MLKNNISEDKVYLFKGEGIIFVGGAPRSGTTLIQRILNAHPEIYGGPEFDVIPLIIDLRNRFQKGIRSGRISIFLNKQEADRAFALFIKELLFVKKEKEHAKFISEKTPANILKFPELIKILPEARFIFVVRDPRAIVSSMMDVRKKGENISFVRDLGSCVRYINKCWESGCNAMVSTKKVNLVKYEDIITKTDETVKQLFLSLGLRPRSIDISSSNFEMPSINKKGSPWYTTDQLRAPVYQSSLDAWKKKLKPMQIKFIENSIKGDYIRKLYLEKCKHSKIYNILPNIGYVINKTNILLRRCLKDLMNTTLD